MDIITYVDTIGRTCFGEVVEKTAEHVKVKAPAMIMVTPNDPNNMKVDVMPLFFTEFSEGAQPVFIYKAGQYIEIEVDISDKILKHYSAKINTNGEANTEPVVEKLGEKVPEVTLFED